MSNDLRQRQVWRYAMATLLLLALSIGSGLAATTPISGEPRTSMITRQDDLLIDSTNSGAGNFTTHKVAASVLLSTVQSATVPAGSFTTNYTGNGGSITAATLTNQANGSDAWQFFSGQSNVIRFRFALPWDWDAGTVKVGLRGVCFGANNAAATNVVWQVQAASIPNGGSESSLTFGTAVWVTNRISTSANVSREDITTALTVGNSPSATNSIIWDIQRLGGQAGDNLTNNAFCLEEVRIFFNRTVQPAFPPSSP